jgi:hypothetical protein
MGKFNNIKQTPLVKPTMTRWEHLREAFRP